MSLLPHLIIYLICLLYTPKVFAQEVIYNFKYFGKREGLPVEKIRDAVQDSRGILWMATDKGLINYDGFRFHHMQFSPPHNQFINDLKAISLDPNSSKIWLATHNEGLVCYDRNKPLSESIRVFKAKVGVKKLIKNELYAVFASKNGIVYFGGQETGLQYYDPKADSVQYVRLSSRNIYETIYSIQEDNKGLIWIGTRYDGFYVYDPKTKNIRNINLYNKGENSATSFAFVGNKVFLNYYDHNLSSLEYSLDKISNVNLLGIGSNNTHFDNAISDICYLERKNKLLIGHITKGLYEYDISSRTSKNIRWEDISPDLPRPTKINRIIPTSNGAYIATNDGLYFYADELNSVNELIRLSVEVEEIFTLNNELWYRSKNQLGRLSADLKSILYTISTKGLNISKVNVVNNRLYLSTYDNGVYTVDIQSKRIHPLLILGNRYSFDYADCNTILGDSIEGLEYLWIGSWNSGVYKYNVQSKELQLFNTSNGLIDNKVITIGKDKYDTLWLGMDGYGLIKVKDKINGVFENYHHDPSNSKTVSSNSILSFLLDKNNNFWYGSSTNGIGKIITEDIPQFIHYHDPHPLKKLYPTELVSDSFGRIWMKTADGVMIFNTSVNRFVHLEEGDMIFPINKYKPKTFYLHDNQIIWITKLGLIKIAIEKLPLVDIKKLKPIVSQFRILNKDYSYKLNSSNIVLEPDENSFAFYFACPDLLKNANIRFAYKLVGIHSDWVIADDSHQAIFTNIAEGKYKFEYKIGDLEGNWSDHTSSYTIEVKAFWYHSKLFRVLVALIIFMLIIGFLFYRIIQHKKVNKLHHDFNEKLKQELRENEKKIMEQTEKIEFERQEKLEADFRKKLYESELKAIRSQMNPHFIFNILNSIEAYVVENNKIKASKLIHKFAALSRIVLENSQHARVNIESELGLVQLYLDLERERFDNMFDYTIEIKNNINTYRDKIPSMLIQPIVENAIHHGIRHLSDKKGFIKIRIEESQGNIIISVSDNGVGFDYQSNSSIKKTSFGIKGVENRLKMMNKEGYNIHNGIFIKHNSDESEFKTVITMVFPLASFS